MKQTKHFSIILLCLFFILGSQGSGIGQGCVAIRSTGASCTALTSHDNNDKGWQLNTTYRYYKSFRHFRGEHEEAERVANQSDVRNYTNFLDFSIVKNFNSRWSMSLTIPFQHTKRTSLYEHDGKTRHATSATGLGDIRVTAYSWIFNPNSRGNVQLGLGVKLPTGDYRYSDYFYKNDTTEVFGPVDQSIQPGDGGTGFTTELNAYVNIYKGIGAYSNAYYLFNPRNVNGTSSARGGTPSATAIKYRTAFMSVADQYMFRGGLYYTTMDLTFSAGIRVEGVPSEDAIGESNGFRRPGYTIGFEPSVAYRLGKYDFYASVPVALERNRTQSDSDKRRTIDTGTLQQGDAAFADYSINIGFSYRFGGSKKHEMSDMETSYNSEK